MNQNIEHVSIVVSKQAVFEQNDLCLSVTHTNEGSSLFRDSLFSL
jgi:hypothetical protein